VIANTDADIDNINTQQPDEEATVTTTVSSKETTRLHYAAASGHTATVQY
jgi:hypothetical protein